MRILLCFLCLLLFKIFVFIRGSVLIGGRRPPTRALHASCDSFSEYLKYRGVFPYLIICTQFFTARRSFPRSNGNAGRRGAPCPSLPQSMLRICSRLPSISYPLFSPPAPLPTTRTCRDLEAIRTEFRKQFPDPANCSRFSRRVGGCGNCRAGPHEWI